MYPGSSISTSPSRVTSSASGESSSRSSSSSSTVSRDWASTDIGLDDTSFDSGDLRYRNAPYFPPHQSQHHSLPHSHPEPQRSPHSAPHSHSHPHTMSHYSLSHNNGHAFYPSRGETQYLAPNTTPYQAVPMGPPPSHPPQVMQQQQPQLQHYLQQPHPDHTQHHPAYLPHQSMMHPVTHTMPLPAHPSHLHTQSFHAHPPPLHLAQHQHPYHPQLSQTQHTQPNTQQYPNPLMNYTMATLPVHPTHTSAPAMTSMATPSISSPGSTGSVSSSSQPTHASKQKRTCSVMNPLEAVAEATALKRQRQQLQQHQHQGSLQSNSSPIASGNSSVLPGASSSGHSHSHAGLTTNESAIDPQTLQLQAQLQQEIDSLRQERLNTLDAIFDAFNVCDVEALYKVTQLHCHADMIFRCNYVPETQRGSSSSSQSSSTVGCSFIGRNTAFIFWNFTHEAYPDAMMKILERRIISQVVPTSSNATAASVATEEGQEPMPVSQHPDLPAWYDEQYQQASRSLSRVEYVYKFTGTRITSRSAQELFAEFMHANPLQSTMEANYDDLTLNMVRFVTSSAATGPQQHDASSSLSSSSSAAEGGSGQGDIGGEEAKSYIMEAVLTFDPTTNLIKEWTLELLAG